MLLAVLGDGFVRRAWPATPFRRAQRDRRSTAACSLSPSSSPRVAALLVGPAAGAAGVARRGRRLAARRRTPGRPAGSRRTRNVLVAAEVALALVLLTGAGLLMRTLWGMQRVERGFTHRPRRHGDGEPAGRRLPDRRRRRAPSTRGCIERVRAVPGVESAALTTGVLLPLLANSATFTFEGKPLPPPEQRARVPDRNRVAGLLRDDRRADGARPNVHRAGPRAGARRSSIVNETLARSIWPGEDPIGKPAAAG